MKFVTASMNVEQSDVITVSLFKGEIRLGFGGGCAVYLPPEKAKEVILRLSDGIMLLKSDENISSDS